MRLQEVLRGSKNREITFEPVEKADSQCSIGRNADRVGFNATDQSGCNKTSWVLLSAPEVSTGAVKFQSVTSERRAVTAVASIREFPQRDSRHVPGVYFNPGILPILTFLAS